MSEFAIGDRVCFEDSERTWIGTVDYLDPVRGLVHVQFEDELRWWCDPDELRPAK